MEKSKEVIETANSIYTKSLNTLEEQLAKEMSRAETLRKAAVEVCDHSAELVEAKTRRCGTHGRDEENYESITCAICNTLLRTT